MMAVRRSASSAIGASQSRRRRGTREVNGERFGGLAMAEAQLCGNPRWKNTPLAAGIDECIDLLVPHPTGYLHKEPVLL